MEEKKVEVKDLPPEVQELIAKKIAEASAEVFEKLQLKQPSWIKRAWRELVLPKPEGLPLATVKNRQDALRRDMLCIMACPQSGFKARKNITDMTEIQIQARADLAVTKILNLEVFVLAAESVIVRHGLKEEYTSITDKILTELRPMYPMPTPEEVARMQALIAGGEDGNIVGFSDAGTEGEGAVDSESVQGDQQGETTPGEGSS
jgi:hypothetical protein